MIKTMFALLHGPSAVAAVCNILLRLRSLKPLYAERRQVRTSCVKNKLSYQGNTLHHQLMRINSTGVSVHYVQCRTLSYSQWRSQGGHGCMLRPS